jgi:NAD(P)-dependent dehydrogenase (short-subunit alcohol dehydrogenase family)
MLAIRGFSSSMAQAFLDFVPPWETVVPVERGAGNCTASRHLFCQGLLVPKPLGMQTKDDITESFEANCASTVRQCNIILATNPKARICVIGSESGFQWSFDDVYAASKAALHRYVETKRLRSGDQQLVCVAPSIIEDSNMTSHRADTDNLERRRVEHPKGRFLRMSEVCRMIHFLLYVDEGYTTNTVIRMNGGGHIR